MADLPDPYEPLLLMYERGGYSIEEFIDLYGVMIPYGNFESNLHAEPFRTLEPSTLADGQPLRHGRPCSVGHSLPRLRRWYPD